MANHTKGGGRLRPSNTDAPVASGNQAGALGASDGGLGDSASLAAENRRAGRADGAGRVDPARQSGSGKSEKAGGASSAGRRESALPSAAESQRAGGVKGASHESRARQSRAGKNEKAGGESSAGRRESALPAAAGNQDASGANGARRNDSAGQSAVGESENVGVESAAVRKESTLPAASGSQGASGAKDTGHEDSIPQVEAEKNESANGAKTASQQDLARQAEAQSEKDKPGKAKEAKAPPAENNGAPETSQSPKKPSSQPEGGLPAMRNTLGMHEEFSETLADRDHGAIKSKIGIHEESQGGPRESADEDALLEAAENPHPDEAGGDPQASAPKAGLGAEDQPQSESPGLGDTGQGETPKGSSAATPPEPREPPDSASELEDGAPRRFSASEASDIYGRAARDQAGAESQTADKRPSVQAGGETPVGARPSEEPGWTGATWKDGLKSRVKGINGWRVIPLADVAGLALTALACALALAAAVYALGFSLGVWSPSFERGASGAARHQPEGKETQWKMDQESAGQAGGYVGTSSETASQPGLIQRMAPGRGSESPPQAGHGGGGAGIQEACHKPMDGESSSLPQTPGDFAASGRGLPEASFGAAVQPQASLAAGQTNLAVPAPSQMQWTGAPLGQAERAGEALAQPKPAGATAGQKGLAGVAPSQMEWTDVALQQAEPAGGALAQPKPTGAAAGQVDLAGAAPSQMEWTDVALRQAEPAGGALAQPKPAGAAAGQVDLAGVAPSQMEWTDVALRQAEPVGGTLAQPKPATTPAGQAERARAPADQGRQAGAAENNGASPQPQSAPQGEAASQAARDGETKASPGKAPDSAQSPTGEEIKAIIESALAEVWTMRGEEILQTQAILQMMESNQKQIQSMKKEMDRISSIAEETLGKALGALERIGAALEKTAEESGRTRRDLGALVEGMMANPGAHDMSGKEAGKEPAGAQPETGKGADAVYSRLKETPGYDRLNLGAEPVGGAGHAGISAKGYGNILDILKVEGKGILIRMENGSIMLEAG